MALYHDHASAIKAVAHKMARIIYALFKNHTAYDPTKLDRPTSEKAIARITAKLAHETQKLGYVVVQAKA